MSSFQLPLNYYFTSEEDDGDFGLLSDFLPESVDGVDEGPVVSDFAPFL
jgi:hypothetical protein